MKPFFYVSGMKAKYHPSRIDNHWPGILNSELTWNSVKNSLEGEHSAGLTPAIFVSCL